MEGAVVEQVLQNTHHSASLVSLHPSSSTLDALYCDPEWCEDSSLYK
jgi:hypothetical protein